MKKRNRAELTGQELLKAWENAKQNGLTKRQFAESIGLSYQEARGRIERAINASRDHEKPAPLAQPDNEVKADIQGNYMELESGFNRRIVSLDDLLEAGKVDRSAWEVERYVINKWEVGAKTASRHFVWQDGQIIEGHLDDPGELTIEPLIQVKAWLVRKKPLALEPTIQPVVISPGSINLRPTKKRDQDGWRSALILPDTQYGFRRDLNTGALTPYHSRAALDVVLQVAGEGRFDRLVFLGDTLDLADWSDKFIRSPDFFYTTQAAIVEGAWWLAQFRRAAPDAEIDVIEGNHDKRMADAVSVHLAAAYNLRPATEIASPPALSIPRLLALDSIGATWAGNYPHGTVWLNDQLACIHGEVARNGPGATSAALIDGANHSVIFGHIHRIEQATRTINGRGPARAITAASPGCLCRLDFVVPGHTRGTGLSGWQNGFAVVYYHENGSHFIHLYHITGDRAIYRGKIYQAQNRLEEIQRDTGGLF